MDKRRILVVDNNAGLRAMLAQVLGDLGHEVVTAGDRDEALAREDRASARSSASACSLRSRPTASDGRAS